MASALSADRLPPTIPSASSEDGIGRFARALVASMSRAKDAVRLEREAAEERRSRLEQQASFERARAETQARDAERAQMLDRCLAEFQDDSVQLVTAVSRVSERLHDLSSQAADRKNGVWGKGGDSQGE